MLQSLTKHGLGCAKVVDTAIGAAYPKPLRFIAGYNMDYIIHLKVDSKHAKMTIRMTDQYTHLDIFENNTQEYRDCISYLETQNVVDHVQQMINYVKKELE